jgi:hypothetical protein
VYVDPSVHAGYVEPPELELPPLDELLLEELEDELDELELLDEELDELELLELLELELLDDELLPP